MKIPLEIPTVNQQKKMENKHDEELAELIFRTRERLTDDMGPELDLMVEMLSADGLTLDQIHLFMETLIMVDRLPN